MPRRRNQPIQHLEGNIEEEYDNTTPLHPIYIQQEEAPPICCNFLKKNYWDMSQKLAISYECSICLSKIDCSKCFTILSNCGHIFDLGCISAALKLNNGCPLCRSQN